MDRVEEQRGTEITEDDAITLFAHYFRRSSGSSTGIWIDKDGNLELKIMVFLWFKEDFN